MTKASVPCRSLQKCCAGNRAQLGFLLDGRVCQSDQGKLQWEGKQEWES